MKNTGNIADRVVRIETEGRSNNVLEGFKSTYRRLSFINKVTKKRLMENGG